MKGHNGSFRCHLHQKKKKTRDMTDRIIYAGRQNEIMQRIIWVPSMPKKKKNTRHDGSYSYDRRQK